MLADRSPMPAAPQGRLAAEVAVLFSAPAMDLEQQERPRRKEASVARERKRKGMARKGGSKGNKGRVGCGASKEEKPVGSQALSCHSPTNTATTSTPGRASPFSEALSRSPDGAQETVDEANSLMSPSSARPAPSHPTQDRAATAPPKPDRQLLGEGERSALADLSGREPFVFARDAAFLLPL